MAGSRYLLDTNILISGLLFKGNKRRLLALGREKRATLLVSDIILKEFQRVLGEKFAFTREDVDLALAYVLESVEEIIVIEQQDYILAEEKVRDRADVHLLVAAKKGKAILVTEDRDILEIPVKKVKVMRCAEVLKLFEGSSGGEKT